MAHLEHRGKLRSRTFRSSTLKAFLAESMAPAPSAEAIEEKIPVVQEVESSSDADDIEEVHQEI